MLRRVSVVFVVCGLSQAILSADQAQPISWRTNFQTAHAEMQQKQRPMLLYVTMRGCVYCERMKAETFSQKWIAGELNEKYVAVQIDGPQHAQITKQLKLRVYPTTAIVHPNGRVVEVLHGYQPPAHFVQRMAVAKAKLGEAKVAAKRVADRN